MRDRWADFHDGRGPIFCSQMSDADLAEWEDSIRQGENEDTIGSESADLLLRIQVEHVIRRITPHAPEG